MKTRLVLCVAVLLAALVTAVLLDPIPGNSSMLGPVGLLIIGGMVLLLVGVATAISKVVPCTQETTIVAKNVTALILIAAGLVGYVVATVYPFVRDTRRHSNVADRMHVALLRLAEDHPPELTEDQWAYCIAWTMNLYGNFGLNHNQVPTDDLERIEKELQKRIDRGADLATIDWIWDQFTQSCPRIRERYDHYRPTAPHNKAAFEAGAHGGLSGWRKEYKAHLRRP